MNDSQCAGSESFALRVIGSDMAPEFEDGHIIIVDPGGIVSSGCFVVAKMEDEYLFRQLEIVENSYRLSALQPDIAEIVLPGGADDIIGVITQRSGRRRSQHKHYV